MALVSALAAPAAMPNTWPFHGNENHFGGSGGALSEGTVIAGKYRLDGLLGRGGMGAVWRAHDLDLNAQVAVKLLDASIAATGEGLARFHREAEAAAALRSPHVVQILARGVDTATGQPYIAMELMEGRSLAACIEQEGVLSPAVTARVLSHVARALGRAHDAGIVHRDLKPDNIFLVRNDDEEIAKVLDFGIAKSERHGLSTGSHTRTGAVMGTPYYMSPEQISGAKTVDFRTDLWAFGVIACECLTGRRPFEADTYGGLTLKICAEPIPRASSLGPVPAGFDEWFARAVARDQQLRFNSAREASDELRRICSGLIAVPASVENLKSPHALHATSTSALARSAPREPEFPLRRSRVRWLLAAGSLLALAAGALWVWRNPWGSEGPLVAAQPSALVSSPAEPAVVPPAPAPVPVAPAPAVTVAAAPSAVVEPAPAPLSHAVARPARPATKPRGAAVTAPRPSAPVAPAAPKTPEPSTKPADPKTSATDSRATPLGTAIVDRK
jgi:eukaryotic-like serine/threonine-protein kinase